MNTWTPRSKALGIDVDAGMKDGGRTGGRSGSWEYLVLSLRGHAIIVEGDCWFPLFF